MRIPRWLDYLALAVLRRSRDTLLADAARHAEDERSRVARITRGRDALAHAQADLLVTQRILADLQTEADLARWQQTARAMRKDPPWTGTA